MSGTINYYQKAYCSKPAWANSSGWMDIVRLFDPKSKKWVKVPKNFAPKTRPTFCVPQTYMAFVNLLQTRREREMMAQAAWQRENEVVRGTDGYSGLGAVIQEDGPVFDINGKGVPYTYLPSGAAKSGESGSRNGEYPASGLTYKSQVHPAKNLEAHYGAAARYTTSTGWEKYDENNDVAQMVPEKGTSCSGRTIGDKVVIESGYFFAGGGKGNVLKARGGKSGDTPYKKNSWVHYVRSNNKCYLIGQFGSLSAKETYLRALKDVEKNGSKSPYFVFSGTWTSGKAPTAYMKSFAKKNKENALIMFRPRSTLGKEAFDFYELAEEGKKARENAKRNSKGAGEIDLTCHMGFSASFYRIHSGKYIRQSGGAVRPMWNPWTLSTPQISFLRSLPVCEDELERVATREEEVRAKQEYVDAQAEIAQLERQILEEAGYNVALSPEEKAAIKDEVANNTDPHAQISATTVLGALALVGGLAFVGKKFLEKK